MSDREEIKETRYYYQGFHHKCITWYLTVMGFFIAGALAAQQGSANCKVGWVLMASAALFGILFFVCIFHYSARIAMLNDYFEGPENKIPPDWRKTHKKCVIGFRGAGSLLFLMILISMPVVLVVLVGQKFLGWW